MITYLIGKIKFKLLFHGPLAEQERFPFALLFFLETALILREVRTRWAPDSSSKRSENGAPISRVKHHPSYPCTFGRL